jgi:hypothetical protein
MVKILFAALLLVPLVAAQTVKNPKLSAADLTTAKAEAEASGGSDAELVYANRLDAVEKGKFDSLAVFYLKPQAGGPQYFGVIVTDAGAKYPLKADKSGQVLPTGDRFLHIGLKYEEGKAPLLRVMGAGHDQQHNFDFRFSGTEFTVVDRSQVPLPSPN